MEHIDLMLAVSKALFSKNLFTTSALGKKLNVSQQNVSIGLRKLESNGLLYREPTTSGIYLEYTEKGRQFLIRYRDQLKIVLKSSYEVKGKVFSGIGEGRFYTELPGYKKEFKKKLDISPYPGTLNIKLKDGEKQEFLHDKEPIMIEGFKTKNRTFGWIKCYLIRIQNLRAAITVPERTVHKSTLEVISRHNLRKKLKLEDKDEVLLKWEKTG